MKDKLYRVEITRSQTVSMLIEDTSAISAVLRANTYANTYGEIFNGMPYEYSRKTATIVREDCLYDPVDVDLTMQKEAVDAEK